jgi:hypothetical protein
MAKIENTQAYPTVTPAASDLLIATDVSNNNETVTFLVSDIAGGSGVLQDLQSVLTTGDTAIEDINLTGTITVIGTVAPTTITALGSTGVAGQILSSTGTGLQWINSPSVTCCDWEDTLIADPLSSVDAFMDGASMTFTNAGAGIIITTPATLSNSGISTFTGEVQINGTDLNFNATGQINDSAGTTGAVGQWLTATATGVEWSSTIPPASCCDLQSTLNIGSTSFNQGMTFTGTSSITFDTNVSIGSAGNNVWSGTNTFSGTLDVDGCIEDSLGTCGAAGQILMSTGTAVQWSTGAGIGAQNLQGVLDTAPFGATGVNANLVISGTLNAGTITDNSGSTGAVGQILSMSGAGLTWTAAGGTGVTDLSIGGVVSSTGLPIEIVPVSPATGSVTINQTRYTGGTNEGCVPRGSANDATKYLDGTGAWTVPAGGGGAVTSVTLGAGAVSAGPPLVITPTTGAVVVDPQIYNGAGNTGFVPSGGTASTFLRGDGTWASGGITDTNSQELTFINRLVKYGPPYTAGDYMALNPALNSAFTGPDNYNHVLTSGNPSATPPTVMETFAGSVFRVPTDGCSTGKPNFTICSMTTAGVLGIVDTSPTVLTIEVWRLPNGPCASGDTYLAGTCTMSFTAASTPVCCAAGTIVSTGNQIFQPGDAMMLTWRMDQDITSNSLYQIWKCWIRGEWTA